MKRTAERIDRLAAEYVLGTLQGPARRRFQTWCAEDPAAAAAVAAWAARLSPLAEVVPAVTPSARVWRRLAARIAPAAAAPQGFRGWLSGWRPFLVGAALATVVVGTSLNLLLPTPAGGAYIAVMNNALAQPVIMVSASRKSLDLTVKIVQPFAVAGDRSLELWAVPKSGAPVSLGLLQANGKTKLKLPRPADDALGEIPNLAVSLEPQGGSPSGQPTGPVVYQGPCIKMW